MLLIISLSIILVSVSVIMGIMIYMNVDLPQGNTSMKNILYSTTLLIPLVILMSFVFLSIPVLTIINKLDVEPLELVVLQSSIVLIYYFVLSYINMTVKYR